MNQIIEFDDKGVFNKMAGSLQILADIRTISKSFIGKVVTVGTTPTLLIDSYRKASAYTIINPTAAVGATSVTNLLPLLTNFNLAAVSSAVNVANYDSARVFLDLTAIGVGGNLEVFAQSLDTLSGNYVDIQSIFNVNAAGTYYANLGSMGVDTSLKLRWSLTGTTSCTGSVSVVLKEGLGGASAVGSNLTVYLGNEGVATQSGFPILEGQSRDFYVKENIKIFGVATTPVDLRIIEWS